MSGRVKKHANGIAKLDFNLDVVRTLLWRAGMETASCSLVRDGDEIFVAVPENKTVEFYQYLRGFGFHFTIDCRGFCEDNVFSFAEGENVERLNAIIGRFRLC